MILHKKLTYKQFKAILNYFQGRDIEYHYRKAYAQYCKDYKENETKS